MRISVDQPVKTAETKVYPVGAVMELIEKYGSRNQIAVVECMCREWHKVVDKPCRFDMPARSCLVIGELTRHALRYDSARPISKDQALELVAELQRKGAVHQVFHEGEDLDKPEIAICNCCWDCCGVFGSYNRGYMPLQLQSYFAARMTDPLLCTGCGICADHCPVQAILVEDAKAAIQEGKCIGCGQCELQCPAGAIELVSNERHVFLPLRKMSEARIAV